MEFNRRQSCLIMSIFLLFLCCFQCLSSSASLLNSSSGPSGLVHPFGRPSLAISDANSSFILAADRTLRKDPLNGFKDYTGGWNISNQHYWASVGFSAAPIFAIAAIWFIVFGIVLFFIICCYCCCPGRSYSYSTTAYTCSLILLILFSGATIIGCIVLYEGQSKFHDTTRGTVNYVLGQANDTVSNLRNFSNYLVAARTAGAGQVSLSNDLKSKIDNMVNKVNTSADDLATHTSNNSNNITNVLDTVWLILIVVAAVMLLLAFLGLLLSLCGMQFLLYILVVAGWVLVAGTFILCGTFLLLHNLVADTCVAMDEWVLHPHSHTALDDILPCVDPSMTNEAMNQSKVVTYQLISMVNNLITNVSNGNFPPTMTPLYYNQSGPLVPVLCNPYMPDMSNRTCTVGELGFDNAKQVWQGYICRTTVVSGNEICTTTGRLTPAIYTQLVGVVNTSYGLYYYGPYLSDLADCTFVRQTFKSISNNNCPGLGRYSDRVYIGLLTVSVAVMLSLIFWVVYARERKHRKYYKKQFDRLDRTPIQEKAFLSGRQY